MSFEFKPVAGLVTENCYLHGINSKDYLGTEGTIEYVGPDYFVLRPRGCQVIAINKADYRCIFEDDFKSPL